MAPAVFERLREEGVHVDLEQRFAHLVPVRERVRGVDVFEDKWKGSLFSEMERDMERDIARAAVSFRKSTSTLIGTSRNECTPVSEGCTVHIGEVMVEYRVLYSNFESADWDGVHLKEERS
jgi:hypothetical protein